MMRYYFLLLLFLLAVGIKSQSWLKIPGSDDFYPFVGGTNDDLFIKGKSYMLSVSPLSVFKGYESIYYITDEIKYSVSYDIPVSQDKDYSIYWAIGPDSMLYLCDMDIWDEDDFNRKVWMNLNEYVDPGTIQNVLLNRNLLHHINPSKYMRHIPIERLTGQKFRQSVYFNPYIMNMPINVNGVLPAIWYSDTLYVKQRENAFEMLYDSYYQLVFKEGRIAGVNRIIPKKTFKPIRYPVRKNRDDRRIFR